MRPTYGATLLAECLCDSGGAMEVVRMQPPDGMQVRDVLGNVYTVMVYEQDPGPGPADAITEERPPPKRWTAC